MTVIHSICCEAMSDNLVLTLFLHECQYKSEIGSFSGSFWQHSSNDSPRCQHHILEYTV